MWSVFGVVGFLVWSLFCVVGFLVWSFFSVFFFVWSFFGFGLVLVVVGVFVWSDATLSRWCAAGDDVHSLLTSGPSVRSHVAQAVEALFSAADFTQHSMC